MTALLKLLLKYLRYFSLYVYWEKLYASSQKTHQNINSFLRRKVSDESRCIFSFLLNLSSTLNPYALLTMNKWKVTGERHLQSRDCWRWCSLHNECTRWGMINPHTQAQSFCLSVFLSFSSFHILDQHAKRDLTTATPRDPKRPTSASEPHYASCFCLVFYRSCEYNRMDTDFWI